MGRIAKRRDKRPLEAEIEKKACDYGRKTGWIMRKYTSPSHRSVPDRMCLHDMGAIVFIEFKRPGEKATSAQQVEHEALRRRGFAVFVVDSVEEACRVLDAHNPWMTD